MTPRSFFLWLKAHKVKGFFLSAAVILLAAYMFCLPEDLFKDTPYSTVVTDRNGNLLGAKIAEDGQWRFPPGEKVPEKFAAALVEFEDRGFRYHPGVNPASLIRAAYQNISSGKTVSGGSTITMQVIRMSRNRERNIWQKAVEIILATRLELRCSKDEIMAMYAAHAPFGGNVVGLEAASWRYFGRPSDYLSWGEAALLAVLPNSPSLIHPGKNREMLYEKRNRLLKRLKDKGLIDEETFELSCEEPLPDRPVALPQHAPHLCAYYGMTAGGKHIVTGIDLDTQKKAEEITERWGETFRKAGINDLAAVIIDVRSGLVVAYCGNTGFNSGRTGCQVDAAGAPRSTGSILKPLLYCALLQDGEILPNTLLPDIPVNINGFSPQNFDREFYGAVPAANALSRSLNVPAVHMLRRYGVPKFRDMLKKAGMTTLDRPASDYGLSLILGGAEGRLDEITSVYANLAAVMMKYGRVPESFPFKDECAVWYTLEALKEVNRPDEIDWKSIRSVKRVAWKTGTSYGFRDAWAVGVTPDYAVGVWVGNAQGQGSPGLTGARTAGPVMFELFNMLPGGSWFPMPEYGKYVMAEVCRESGHLKGPYCDHTDTLMLPLSSSRSSACPYHKPVVLTNDKKYRTAAGSPGATTEHMFILPPAMEWYYRARHPEYESPPPPEPGSFRDSGYNPMEFIYPENGSSIYIPKQLDGTTKGAVFNLAHRNPSSTVFWHIDNKFIDSTRYIHQLSVNPTPGRHTVTVVDENGFSLSAGFTVENPHKD